MKKVIVIEIEVEPNVDIDCNQLVQSILDLDSNIKSAEVKYSAGIHP